MQSLIKWWKDSADKQYTVSDATDATNGWGPLPVSVVGTGVAAADLGKAEGAAHTTGDVGVAIWGVRNDAALTTFGADQNYGPIATDFKGRVLVAVGNAVATGDGASATAGYLADSSGGSRALPTYNYVFNGTTFDRQRNNIDGTALASAGRTITTSSADLVNHNGRGVDVVLDMTVVGTGSVTLTIQGRDVLSGQYYTILAGAAVVTNVANVYRVYPGLLAVANVAANAVIPRTWRVTVTANNANSATYSVGFSNVL